MTDLQVDNDLKFVWNDGGRAAAGFVGHAGDCVTRALAIATGKRYREVYDALAEISGESARNGVCEVASQRYLRELGWKYGAGCQEPPHGIAIATFELRRSGHYAAVIDGEVHDTWNPFEDHRPTGYYTHPGTDDGTPALAPLRVSHDDAGEITDDQYNKVLDRIRALRRTAANDASTEGEIRNAVRMAQTLMLKHNLSDADLTESEQIDATQMTRRRTWLNGRRSCQWEASLAWYITENITSTVQWYYDTHNKRTAFYFYGPRDDVDYALELFRELLVTIAASARMNHGGYARGSGASYARGYVDGLPRSNPESIDARSRNLIKTRMLAVQRKANGWLKQECGITIHSSSGSNSNSHDPDAYCSGRRDGSTQTVPGRGGVKRLTYRT